MRSTTGNLVFTSFGTKIAALQRSMRAMCADCQREGRSGFLGERPPLDDPTETHGICPHHTQKLLAQIPSLTFPGVRLLLVVAPKETDLYEHLTRVFAGMRDVKVIVERRQMERRTMRRDAPVERRDHERRLRRSERCALGYVTVRFGRR